MNNIKVAHVGSYFEGDNDIVKQMFRSISSFPVFDVREFDFNIYAKYRFLRFNLRPDGTLLLRRHNFRKVLKALPRILILNAGNLALSERQFSKLKELNIFVVGIGLSDPDLKHIGLRISRNVDIYFTNSQLALEWYRESGANNCHFIKFATESVGDLPNQLEKISDVVIAGGMREDRVPIVNLISDAGFTVACFGRSWDSLRVPRALISNSVRGDAYTSAIRSGKIYLSFSKTAAGFENLKVGALDAAAQGACVLTHHFSGIENFFKIGSEILTYKDSIDLLEVLRGALSNQNEYINIGLRAQQRVSREHLWEMRWGEMFNYIESSPNYEKTR